MSGSDRCDYAYLFSAMETFLYFPAQTGIAVLVLMLLTEDRDTALAIPYIASIVWPFRCIFYYSEITLNYIL